MNEGQLRDLLRNPDQDTVVGAPPHGAIVALARRRRRSRAVVLASAALATTVVLGVASTQHMIGTQASPSRHHHILATHATQAPSPDDTDTPAPDDAAFRGTWRVESMATFDPEHPHENGGITTHYIRPDQLTLTLSETSWRADVPCGHMSGQLDHDGADLEHRDPVHADMDSCVGNTAPNGQHNGPPHRPPLRSAYGETINLANLMLRVHHWSLAGGQLHLHSQSWQIIIALKRAS